MPPAKINRSDQFGVHIGMSIFPAYNRTLQAITQVQIRLEFFERNKSGILDSNDWGNPKSKFIAKICFIVVCWEQTNLSLYFTFHGIEKWENEIKSFSAKLISFMCRKQIAVGYIESEMIVWTRNCQN